MTILMPDRIGKCSLERVHPFLTEVVSKMNSLLSHYSNRKHQRVATETGCFLFQLPTRTACIHFASTASEAKLFSRVDNSLIICRGQFISTIKTEEWTENKTLEEKVQKTFVELLPKN